MAFLFAITTPVGVAIGIGIQSTYNANSLANLVVSGVFDSISTGTNTIPAAQPADAHILHRDTRSCSPSRVCSFVPTASVNLFAGFWRPMLTDKHCSKASDALNCARVLLCYMPACPSKLQL